MCFQYRQDQPGSTSCPTAIFHKAYWPFECTANQTKEPEWLVQSRKLKMNDGMSWGHAGRYHRREDVFAIIPREPSTLWPHLTVMVHLGTLGIVVPKLQRPSEGLQRGLKLDELVLLAVRERNKGSAGQFEMLYECTPRGAGVMMVGIKI
jgi:hypothetical protein